MNDPWSSEHLLRGCLIRVAIGVIGLLGATAIALVVALRVDRANEAPTGYLGQPRRGRQLVSRYGCTSCHIVPGESPEGEVGPPLAGFGSQSYIAGTFPNTPSLLELWIRHPQDEAG